MRGLWLILVLSFSSTAFAASNPQAEAAKKILSALKMQEIFRYRASKSFVKEGMQLADQARSPELWLLGAQLAVIAYSLTADHASALEITTEALRRIANDSALKQNEETFIEFAGVLEFKLKQPEKSQAFLSKLAQMQRARGDRKGELGTMHHEAYAFAAGGDYANALSRLEAVLAERSKLDPETVPTVLQSQGKFLQEIGDYKASLEALNQALGLVDGLLKATPEPKEPSVDEHFKTLDQDPTFPERHRYRGLKANRAEILAALGAFYDFSADYETALKRYQDAVDIERTLMISGTRKDELFDIARRLILIHKKLGNMKKAFDIIGAVKTLAEKNDIPTTDIELTYGEFLLSYINHKEHGPESTRKAIDIFERNDRPDLLGVVHLKQKDYARAKAQFARAMTKALYSREADKLVGTHIGAGLAAEGLGELDASAKYLEKAIALMENQRDTLTPSDRAAFFSGEVIGFSRTLPYEALVRVYTKQKQLDSAFWASENIKARRLAEAIAAGRSLNLTLPPLERTQEDGLGSRITGRVRELELAFKRKDKVAYATLEGELDGLRAERDRFVERLRQSYPAYASLRYPKPLLPTELWLGRDETLIEFEVTEEELFIFVVADGKSRVVTRKISREKLSADVDTLRAAFANVTNADDLARFNPELAASLYKTLFDGVLDGLNPKARLILVPDEVLAVLPFDALAVEVRGKQIGTNAFGPFPLGVKYFGQVRAISYAQSGTSLSIARTLESGARGKKLLIAADPVFSVNDARAAGALATESTQQLAAMSEWKTMGVAGTVSREEAAKPKAVEVFPRLEKTSALAQDLRGAFGDDASVYLGKEALERAVKAADLRDYRYLLFATHGILDDTLPYVREPALVMSLVDNPAGDDGFLTASEVMAMKLDAEVVALTACQTGMGKNVSGEGVMGLGRAFEFAGAKRVLMSLWSVSEDSTTLLASRFFRAMQQGQDAATALMTAREALRQKGYENPFYWAAFSLVGAGGKPPERMVVAASNVKKTEPQTSVTSVLRDLEVDAEKTVAPPPPPVPVPAPKKLEPDEPDDFTVSATSLRDKPWEFGHTSGAGAAAGYHAVAGGDFIGVAPFLAYDLSDRNFDMNVTLGALVNFTLSDPQSGAPGGTIRRRDWDEWRDYLKILQSAELSAKGFKLRAGRLTEQDLGSGGLMREYSNALLADIWRVGLSSSYEGNGTKLDLVFTDFGFQTSLLGAYAGVQPLQLAGFHGILGSIRAGLGYAGDFGAPAALRTTDGTTIQVNEQLFPQYDTRGVHGLSVDVSVTPLSFGFLRGRVYGEFDHLFGLGNGLTAGLDLKVMIPSTPIDITIRTEYRSLGSQYLPSYFDQFYEVQRLHFFSGDPTSSGLTKLQFAESLVRAERAHNFFGDFSVNYGRWAGLGATFETGGYATSTSLTLHAQAQIMQYLTLFATYRKRNFAQSSELFQMADNDLLAAYVRSNFLDWLHVYGRIGRSFSWDTGRNRMAAGWEATAAIEILYPFSKK